MVYVLHEAAAEDGAGVHVAATGNAFIVSMVENADRPDVVQVTAHL
jgi:hypothetical protein